MTVDDTIYDQQIDYPVNSPDEHLPYNTVSRSMIRVQKRLTVTLHTHYTDNKFGFHLPSMYIRIQGSLFVEVFEFSKIPLSPTIYRLEFSSSVSHREPDNLTQTNLSHKTLQDVSQTVMNGRVPDCRD